MNDNEFISDVLSHINTDQKTKQHIKTDLSEQIRIARDTDPYFDLEDTLGSPKALAKQYAEKYNVTNTSYQLKTRIDYTSKQTVFGLPLLRINIGGKKSNKVAKGIVAIGDVAIGVIGIGGLSLGIISVGGISLGLGIALGGIALGSLAIGGIAFGIASIGGIAIGIYNIFAGLSIPLG